MSIDPASAARELLRQYGARGPARPTELARWLGIDVEYVSLGPAIRCALVQEQPGRWVIVVNGRPPQEQQEAACAHTLAHWALHKERSIFVCGRDGRDQTEAEANEFTYGLLRSEVAQRKNG